VINIIRVITSLLFPVFSPVSFLQLLTVRLEDRLSMVPAYFGYYLKKEEITDCLFQKLCHVHTSERGD